MQGHIFLNIDDILVALLQINVVVRFVCSNGIDIDLFYFLVAMLRDHDLVNTFANPRAPLKGTCLWQLPNIIPDFVFVCWALFRFLHYFGSVPLRVNFRWHLRGSQLLEVSRRMQLPGTLHTQTLNLHVVLVIDWFQLWWRPQTPNMTFVDSSYLFKGYSKESNLHFLYCRWHFLS